MSLLTPELVESATLEALDTFSGRMGLLVKGAVQRIPIALNVGKDVTASLFVPGEMVWVVHRRLVENMRGYV